MPLQLAVRAYLRQRRAERERAMRTNDELAVRAALGYLRHTRELRTKGWPAPANPDRPAA